MVLPMKAFALPFALYLMNPMVLQAQDIEDDAVRILVFGDSGTGEVDQYRVANGMESFCALKDCQFALMAGDNIYEDGVSSAYDKQFQDKFELPYQSFDIPFYAALGNHDVRPGKKGSQAQIDYTSISEKWNMLGFYYSFKKGDAEIFVINSNEFANDSEQQYWLEDSLKGSNAHWKIVLGHHNPYSVGYHKQIDWLEGSKLSKLEDKLDSILCRYADMYIAGHDHHLQVSKTDCGVVTIVSGAGAKSRNIYDNLVKKQGSNLLYAKGDQLGFHFVELTKESATIEVYDEDANQLYKSSKSK